MKKKESKKTKKRLDELDNVEGILNNVKRLILDFQDGFESVKDTLSYQNKLDLSLRADEVQVLYVDKEKDGYPAQKKATLQELLNFINPYFDVDTSKIRVLTQDMRKTFISLGDTLKSALEMLLKVSGVLGDMTTINIQENNILLDTEKLINIVNKALSSYPEAKEKLSLALLTLEDKNNV